MKSNQNPTTPINQGKIVQLNAHKSSTWLQKATRLHNDGHEGFNMVCCAARLGAQNLAFPRENSFFALIDNMKFIEKSSFEFNYAIEEIQKIYNEAYSISERVDPSQLADVIPFPKSKKEAAQ